MTDGLGIHARNVGIERGILATVYYGKANYLGNGHQPMAAEPVNIAVSRLRVVNILWHGKMGITQMRILHVLIADGRTSNMMTTQRLLQQTTCRTQTRGNAPCRPLELYTYRPRRLPFAGGAPHIQDAVNLVFLVLVEFDDLWAQFSVCLKTDDNRYEFLCTFHKLNLQNTQRGGLYDRVGQWLQAVGLCK